MPTKLLLNSCAGYSSNAATDVRATQDTFVRLTKFFDNCSSSLGITRIASNYGQPTTSYVSATPLIPLTGTSSLGAREFGYWDDVPRSAGANAWACYAFNSASYPFYMLLQWSKANAGALQNFGAIPGFPASSPDTTGGGNGGICVSFALREDKLSPWGGTTINSGSDTKSVPVWSGSSGLHIWPRCNSPYGQLWSGSRASMMAVHMGTVTDGANWFLYDTSVVVNKNNVGFFARFRTDTPGYLIFGEYSPVTASSGPTYFCINSFATTIQNGAAHGPISPLTGTTGLDGGISIKHPNIPDATVVGMTWDYPAPSFGNAYLTPLNVTANVVEDPIILYVKETYPFISGLVGFSWNFFRRAHLDHYETLMSGSRISFNIGSMAWSTGGSVTVPFTGSAIPFGAGDGTRNGAEVFIP